MNVTDVASIFKSMHLFRAFKCGCYLSSDIIGWYNRDIYLWI